MAHTRTKPKANSGQNLQIHTRAPNKGRWKGSPDPLASVDEIGVALWVLHGCSYCCLLSMVGP